MDQGFLDSIIGNINAVQAAIDDCNDASIAIDAHLSTLMLNQLSAQIKFLRETAFASHASLLGTDATHLQLETSTGSVLPVLPQDGSTLSDLRQSTARGLEELRIQLSGLRDFLTATGSNQYSTDPAYKEAVDACAKWTSVSGSHMRRIWEQLTGGPRALRKDETEAIFGTDPSFQQLFRANGYWENAQYPIVPLTIPPLA